MNKWLIKFKKLPVHKAFTLAEIIVVVVVMGIIATLTVPPLVKRQNEMANRTKIKKVMSVYDMAINKISIENNIRSEAELEQFLAPEQYCKRVYSEYYSGCYDIKNNNEQILHYFKVTEQDGSLIKTADGIWWDMSNPLNPTVALKKSDLNNLHNNTTFKFIAHYDNNGILRVNDLQYEINNNTDKTATSQAKKLFAFINNQSTQNSEYESAEYVSSEYKSSEQTFFEGGEASVQGDAVLCSSHGYGDMPQEPIRGGEDPDINIEKISGSGSGN